MKKNLLQRFCFNLTNVFFLLMLFSASANLFGQAPVLTIFRDDFNRNTLGSAWQTQTWSIVNGSAFTGDGGSLSTTAAFTDSSYIIETAAKGFTDHYYREFRFIFGRADLSNDSAYVLRY